MERRWRDRARLPDEQYRTDANLAARQSIYAYQVPRVHLPALVLDLVALTGAEAVADVGCGNGNYLAELARRGHRGPLLGLDLSAGMLAAARDRAPGAGLAVADAAGLPLRAGASDLTLAMHMLYHAADPRAAVRELRRVTRPGGRVLVVLNAPDHLRELRRLIGGRPERVTLDDGADLLAAEFASVTRHEFPGELMVPDSGPVEAYARSMLVPIPPVPAGPFRIRTHSGCLVCR